MSQTVEDRCRAVLVEQLGSEEEEITCGAKLEEDLGMDSLDCVELVMALEEEFNIEIPDEDCPTDGTFGHVVDYMKSRVEASN